MALKKQTIDWREIIEAASRLCADRAQAQGVEIDIRIDEPQAAILVDPEQVKQVLINILINAVQAQPDGGRITVRSYIEAGESIVAVKDRGQGMNADQINSIFDPFFTTKREGTGLGLAISYQLVKNNGGRIWVTSEPGKGACFYIGFPVKMQANA